MSNKTKVGILYGGKSVEHDISVISATNIAHNLDTDRFETILIGIDKTGKWYLTETVTNDIQSGTPLALTLNSKSPSFINTVTNTAINIDIAFPALHGTDGEDGSIQGLLKAVNIPFVGSGVLGSAVSMDKLVTKKLLNQANIPTSNYLSFTVDQAGQIDYNDIVSKLRLPFMAKPANLGSSVGVSKIKDEDSFKQAVDEIFSYDKTIIFEEYITGRELECAVMGNEQPKASVPGEITISDDYDFYTFDAKYVDKDAVKLHIPADVPPSKAEEIKSYCVQAYRALFCEDFARVDLFLTDNGSIYINEINTIPGFTNSSMFPMLWAEEGIAYKELLTLLIDAGFKKSASNMTLNTHFATGL